MLTMVLTMAAAGIAICGATIAVFEIVAAKARRSQSPAAEMPHRARRRAF
jgi:mannose/fructose/N-acetylgalactosamine-specific phosphotransferase system component IIC